MSFRNQVLSALKWTVIGRFSTQLTSWAITIFVMRLLVPDDYGLVAMATIFSGLFALVAEVGLGSSLVQSKEISDRELRQVFAVVLLSNFSVFAALVILVAPLAAAFFGEPRLQLLIQITALQFIPAAFAVLPNALLDREMLYRGRSFVDFFSNLSGGCLTVVLAYQGFGPWSLAWGTVLTAFLRAIGLNWIQPYQSMPLFDFSGIGKIFRFGRDVAANQLVYYLYGQVDSLIVGKLLGKHDLGLYSVSMNLASMPASKMASVLNQVAFPALSKVKRDGGKVNHYITKSIRGISIIAFPVMWGMSSVSLEIVTGLIGEQWLPAVPALAILCLIMPLRVLGPIIHAGLQSVGRADVSFRNTLAAAVIMTLAFVVGCQFGLLGLAIAWAVAFPVVFTSNLIRAKPHLTLSLREVFGCIARPATACGLMYFTVAILRPWLDFPALLRLGILVAAGASVYVVASLLLNREGVSEARQLLKSR